MRCFDSSATVRHIGGHVPRCPLRVAARSGAAAEALSGRFTLRSTPVGGHPHAIDTEGFGAMTQQQAGRKRAKFGRGRPLTPAASYIRRVAAVLVLLMSAVLIPVAPAAASPVPHAPSTVTFGYTGSAVTWTVPDGVPSIVVEAWGAGTCSDDAPNTARGGYAKRTLSVVPGEVLVIRAGGEAPSWSPSGGFNGGGYAHSHASGGGGASDIRQGGGTLSHRQLVAGGAGGCLNYGSAPGRGGDGGGLVGDSGEDAYAGTGATQLAGGSAGGTLGQGGNGIGTTYYCGWADSVNAGGGGGYYGGGGGQAPRSGCSMPISTGTGGGGSGYAPGGDLQTGVRVGHGQVVFTYHQGTPPQSVSVLSPAPNTYWTTASVQEFVVQATDPNGDDYRAEVRIKDTASGQIRDLASDRVASGANATAIAIPPLMGGNYEWQVRACDYPPAPYPAWCGPYSTWMALYVDNPPEAAQTSPREGAQFASGSAQSFEVIAIDPDEDAYTATIEVRDSGNAVVATLTAPSTASGSVASVSASPALSAGPYKWRARACQTSLPASCSAWSGYRNFTVAAPAPAPNQPPATPTQVSPADGYQFAQGEPQAFAVTATDPEGDNFTATIRVKNSTGVPIEFKSGSTASGGNATASPSQPLPQGSYTWDARACASASSSSCSSWSPTRSFSVIGASAGPNRAPEPPEIVEPAANGVFDAGERQDFILNAVDPDGDAYTGEIAFRRLDGSLLDQRVSTSPAPSGMDSSGTLAGQPLSPGTYYMDATVSDARGGSSSTSQQFGVAAPTGMPCDAADTLVDGYFGNRYLQIGTSTADGVGFVCVKTAEGSSAKFAGWLRTETAGGPSGGAPTVGTTAACPDGGEGSVLFPLLDQTVGPPAAQTHLWGALRRTGADVTACFKVKVGTNTLLDHAITISAPQGGELSKLDFVPLDEDAWAPPAEVAPAAGLPSSECYQASSGKTRHVNATVDGQRVFLYSQQEAGIRRVCARIEGVSSGGVVMREHTSNLSQPLTWQVGLPVDHASSPCTADWQWYGSDAPYHARLRTSAPDGDPLGVCLSAGASGPTLATWLKFDRSPDGSVSSHSVDS